MKIWIMSNVWFFRNLKYRYSEPHGTEKELERLMSERDFTKKLFDDFDNLTEDKKYELEQLVGLESDVILECFYELYGFRWISTSKIMVMAILSLNLKAEESNSSIIIQT